MLSSVLKAFSSTKVAVSEAAALKEAIPKISAKIADSVDKSEPPPPDVCELKEVLLNSEKNETNVAKEAESKASNVEKVTRVCPPTHKLPKANSAEVVENLNKLNVKLPVWQIKISDFLQKVQDYVNTKIQKK